MKKVLVAENDVITKKIIDVILMDDEFQVFHAENGPQALEIAQAELPDVIITRISLSEVNGLEIISSLKSEESTANIPVIILASIEEAKEVEKGLQQGARAHILKPFSPMKLYTHIDLAVKGEYSNGSRPSMNTGLPREDREQEAFPAGEQEASPAGEQVFPQEESGELSLDSNELQAIDSLFKTDES
ncbi:MAG: response regulator [Candidatus Eremiobacteraeota bacterium]|nr:response regulator [Candidatus Eremiobacteraeota bacterium]